MTKYIVFLATATIEVEADLVREIDNYEKGITDNQQPAIAFYKGTYQSRDNVVAQFVLKNISGYCKASEIKQLEPAHE